MMPRLVSLLHLIHAHNHLQHSDTHRPRTMQIRAVFLGAALMGFSQMLSTQGFVVPQGPKARSCAGLPGMST